MPLVSVVIPAYNPGPFLDEAVRSVIAQTFTDWECIVVDDGSTEDISRVEKMDSRVRMVRQVNRGLAIARNAGIASAASELIALLDADDLWEPSKFARQVPGMLADAEVGLSYTGFSFIDADGKATGPGWAGPRLTYLEMLGKPGGPLPSATMLRRSALQLVGGFDCFHGGHEDIDVWLKVARYFKVEFLPDALTLYRVHGGNMSGRYRMMHDSITDVLRKHESMARARGDAAALRAARALRRPNRLEYGTQAYEAARRSLKNGDYKDMALHLTRAVANNPRYFLRSIIKTRRSPLGR
ncbi:MAG: glycosyltransferase family 2 protein [Phycisphaerae bacterium]